MSFDGVKREVVSISGNPWVQAAIGAFLVVVGPQVADLVSDGYQASDLSALNVIIGAGTGAAIRALLFFVPTRKA